MDKPKHLYTNPAGDWFVAESVDHARDLAARFYREHGVPPHDDLFRFYQEPDNEIITFHEEHGGSARKLAGEWAAEATPGFFAHDDWQE